MLHVNYKVKYGEIRYKHRDDRQIVKIDIHSANALCAFVYHYTKKDGTKMAQLVSFFADEPHIKRCEKKFESHDCLDFFYGDITSVKLNLYYKESKILLKHFVKHHKVTCYYKEDKK